jgi:hypothetical protein
MIQVQKIWLYCKIRKKPLQLGKLLIFLRKKMTHKGGNYSVKMQKYYFCNGTKKCNLGLFSVKDPNLKYNWHLSERF